MKGTIAFESKIGKGTTFYVILPISKKIKQEVMKKTIPTSKYSGTVLIMDDNEQILNVLSKMIQNLGFSVKLAKNGNEAIKIFKQYIKKNKNFSLVILDLTIPGGIGGRETFKKLYEIDPNIKAIVSSGYSNDPTLSRYKEVGFKERLKKPFTFAELKKIIYQIMH